MSRWMEVRTPAGLLRVTEPTEVVIDGLEPVAEWATGPPEWTLDGRPVTEEEARRLITAARLERGSET